MISESCYTVYDIHGMPAHSTEYSVFCHQTIQHIVFILLTLIKSRVPISAV